MRAWIVCISTRAYVTLECASAQALRHQQFDSSEDLNDIQSSHHENCIQSENITRHHLEVLLESQLCLAKAYPNYLNCANRIVQGSPLTKFCESGGAINAAISVLSHILRETTDGNYTVCTSSTVLGPVTPFHVGLYQRVSTCNNGTDKADCEARKNPGLIAGQRLVNLSEILEDHLKSIQDRRHSSIAHNDILGTMEDATSAVNADPGFLWSPQRVFELLNFSSKCSRFLRASDNPMKDDGGKSMLSDDTEEGEVTANPLNVSIQKGGKV